MKDFKKLGGSVIEDLGQYLRDYMAQYPDTSIYVGTDSQSEGAWTRFITVVALYDEIRKDGVHYVFQKTVEKREKDTFSRMWKEVEMSLKVADYLETALEGHIKRLTPEEVLAIKQAEMEKPVRERDPAKVSFGAHQTKLVNIDVDINPELGGGHNKSNVAYVAAKSYLTGLGYRVRFKPWAWSSSCAADMQLKKGAGKRKRRDTR